MTSATSKVWIFTKSRRSKLEKFRDVSDFRKQQINDKNLIENFILITNNSISKIGVVHNVFLRSKFNVQTSRSFLNYNVVILLKSLASRSIIRCVHTSIGK